MNSLTGFDFEVSADAWVGFIKTLTPNSVRTLGEALWNTVPKEMNRVTSINLGLLLDAGKVNTIEPERKVINARARVVRKPVTKRAAAKPKRRGDTTTAPVVAAKRSRRTTEIRTRS